VAPLWTARNDRSRGPNANRRTVAPFAVHPLPQGGEGNRNRNNAPLFTQGERGRGERVSIRK
jgi:hypothetical protein